MSDQVGLGKALRFVTLDFQILGLQVGFQPPDLAVAVESLLDRALFGIELGSHLALFLRRLHPIPGIEAEHLRERSLRVGEAIGELRLVLLGLPHSEIGSAGLDGKIAALADADRRSDRARG